MLELDHIAVAGCSLTEARDHVEQALGVAMRPGGQHARFATHNTLLGLADGLYLEAIAPDPDAPLSQGPRWFGLDGFTGPARLHAWICRVPDLPSELAGLTPDYGVATPMQRGDLRWMMSVSETGALPAGGAGPMLLQWQSPTPPGNSLPASGCRLKMLTIRAPFPDALPCPADARIRLEQGPVSMQAEFDTPHGPRMLE